MTKNVEVMIEALENARYEVVKNIGQCNWDCEDLSYVLDNYIRDIKKFCKQNLGLRPHFLFQKVFGKTNHGCYI